MMPVTTVSIPKIRLRTKNRAGSVSQAGLALSWGSAPSAGPGTYGECGCGPLPLPPNQGSRVLRVLIRGPYTPPPPSPFLPHRGDLTSHEGDRPTTPTSGELLRPPPIPKLPPQKSQLPHSGPKQLAFSLRTQLGMEARECLFVELLGYTWPSSSFAHTLPNPNVPRGLGRALELPPPATLPFPPTPPSSCTWLPGTRLGRAGPPEQTPQVPRACVPKYRSPNPHWKPSTGSQTPTGFVPAHVTHVALPSWSHPS